MAFGPDGLLASASRDRTVRLWDVAEGRQRAVLNHDSGLTAVVFGPDGKLLAHLAGFLDGVFGCGEARHRALGCVARIAELISPGTQVPVQFGSGLDPLATSTPRSFDAVSSPHLTHSAGTFRCGRHLPTCRAVGGPSR